MPKIEEPKTFLLDALRRGSKRAKLSRKRQVRTLAASDAKRAIIFARQLKVVGRGPRGQIGSEFIEGLTQETRLARSTIYRDIARADALGIAGLRRIEGTSLDRCDELDALVKLPAEKRAPLIERAAAGEQVSAISKPKKGRR